MLREICYGCKRRGCHEPFVLPIVNYSTWLAMHAHAKLSYPFSPYITLLVTSHCGLCRKGSLHTPVHRFCVRVDRKRWVGSLAEWHAHGGCYAWLWKSHGWDQVGHLLLWLHGQDYKTPLSPCWFLAKQAAWALSGCMKTKCADYCMLVNECVWL